MANSVWELANGDVVQRMNACTEANAKTWIFVMLEQLSADVFVKMLVTLWAIGLHGGSRSTRESSRVPSLLLFHPHISG
jgi:hypothetical protein